MTNKNPWLKAMAQARKENPKVKDFKAISVLAKKIYSPKK
jgi:hypothetical protein